MEEMAFLFLWRGYAKSGIFAEGSDFSSEKISGQRRFSLLSFICQSYGRAAFSVMHPRENTGLRYLKKACEYIDANLHETIRIPKVAAYAGINKSYLQSLFARLLGCGIIEYVNKKRMEEAEFLLPTVP